MNLIQFNPTTKLAYTIVRNPEFIPELVEGTALTEKDFPQVDVGIGNSINVFYDVNADTVTYEVIKRPLNKEEQLAFLMSENVTLKANQQDIQAAIAAMMGM